MTELTLITHAAAALLAAVATFGYLRHVSGWKTAFEHSMGSRFAVIEHVLGISNTAPVSTPRSSVPALSGSGVSTAQLPSSPAPAPIPVISHPA